MSRGDGPRWIGFGRMRSLIIGPDRITETDWGLKLGFFYIGLWPRTTTRPNPFGLVGRAAEMVIMDDVEPEDIR